MPDDFDPPVASLGPVGTRASQPEPPVALEGHMTHETGPMHPSAARACALTVAASLMPTEGASLETLAHAPRAVLDWAEIFTRYIETGETP